MAFFGYEVLQGFGQPGGAVGVQAPVGGVVRRAHGGLFADGAAFGHPENGRGAERVVVDRAQHSGDHVSGAFHYYPVSGPYVPLPDVILVMQGGALDGDAADGDGVP